LGRGSPMTKIDDAGRLVVDVAYKTAVIPRTT
jgi:hypothetical protein